MLVHPISEAVSRNRRGNTQCAGRPHQACQISRRRRRCVVHHHPPAHAPETAPMTVADLQEFCTASDEGSKSACRFYIYRIVQGARLAAGVAGDKTQFCIPDDLSSPAMEMIVKLAIGPRFDALSRRSGLGGIRFVGAAIQKAFPCNRRAPRRKAQ